MSLKKEEIIEKIDKFAKKFNLFITLEIGKCLRVKDETVLNVVDYITSRFSSFAILVCGLLFTLLCLKNMVVSFFYKDVPIKLSLSMAIGSLVASWICAYAATKMMEALPKVISSSSCKISSLNFFSVITVLGSLLMINVFIGGIYAAFELKSIRPFLYGVGISVFLEIITNFTANPEKFNIVADETASAGEDFVTITTFFLKIMLRLVPVFSLGLAIFGIFQIIPLIFTTYTQSEGNLSYLSFGAMVADMIGCSKFVFVGLVPLAAYLVYIYCYVAIDILRAILQLPGKLDSLKK